MKNFGKSSWPSLIVLTIAFTFLLATPPGVGAGDHSLSKWENGKFDLVVSLGWTPTSDDKDKLKTIFELFAKDVWRMTEGKHQLRTLYIYTPNKGIPREWKKADIQFTKGGDEALADVSGFQRAGTQIIVKSNFDDLIENGHALAHELGHYAYGFEDEYASDENGHGEQDKPDFPHAKDNAKNTLMSFHKTYQQFSLSADYANVNERETAQWRVYASSCWGLLVRDPKLDVLNSRYSAFLKARVSRYTFPDLIAIKSEPTALTQPTNNPAVKIVYQDDNPTQSSTSVGQEAEAPFSISLEIAGGTYPQPILISATVMRYLKIKGLEVTVVVTDPRGQTFDLPLKDDGVSPDDEAGDGVYTGVLVDYVDGVYQMEVTARNTYGLATETARAYVSAFGYKPTDIPIPDYFEVVETGSFQCSGVKSDDYGNSFDTAFSIPTDGTLISGRIELQGDADYFSFPAQGGTSYTIFTTELFPLDMTTQLKLYASDKQRLLATGVVQPRESGVHSEIIWTALVDGTYYLTVEPAGTTGVYSLGIRTTQETDLASHAGGVDSSNSGACFISNLF